MLLHPPFPRSSSAFVGRDDELERIDELVASEVLFLVYGLAGMGKSELVYKAIEEARLTPRFRSAPALLLQAREGYRAEHLLSILRLRLRVRLGMSMDRGTGTGTSGPLQSDGAPSFSEDLVAVARMLDARPCLIFLDDMQHLDAMVGELLGYLARHVRRSRIFVASRTELVLPPGTPPPVVIRLPPLDVSATAALVSSLSRRMGVADADPAEVFRVSGGCPFLIRRALATPGNGQQDAGQDRTLGELSQEARLVLLLARVLRGRLTTQELEQTDVGAAAIRELSRRFLIDVERGVIIVHDLTWDALRPLWPEADLAAARAEVAQLLARRCEADPGRNAADGVEAVRQLSLASSGDQVQALAMLHRTYAAVAAAGLDHLLLDILPSLRAGFPGDAGAEQRFQLELLAVRIHLRRSDITRAQEILSSLEHLPSALGSLRYLRLAGEVCQRRGRLPEARQLFEKAQAVAKTPRERFQVALLLANVSSLAGDGEEARRVLDAAQRERAQGAETPELGAVEIARLGWSRSLSYLLEDRMVEAAAVAAETTAALSGSGLADASASVMLAMHALIANAECDEVGRARTMLDRILHHAAASGTLREPTAALYRGIVLHAEGDMAVARAALHEALTTLDSHHDHAPAAVAALYLGRTLLALGDVDGVLAATQRAVRLFRAAGLPGLTPHAELVQAQALLATLQLEPARALAQRLMELPHLVPRLRFSAQVVVAGVQLLDGKDPPALADRKDESEAAQHAHSLDRAELSVLLGKMEDAGLRQLLQRTELARQHYARAGRRHLEARAATALAGLLLALSPGGSDELAQADEALGRAQDLCMRHAYGQLHLRCVLLEAALRRRQGSERLAMTTLRQGLDEAGTADDGLELRLLRAASEGSDALLPGLTALLTSLGLRSTRPFVIVDRRGRRDADERERDRVLQACELIIDVERGSICRRGGEAGISGRPLMASLLAALVSSQAECVSAEQLFYDVWGGREYHPLQHRNTIYVAITRLRQALRELLPGRELIETTASGWRLASDVEICAISTNRAK